MSNNLKSNKPTADVLMVSMRAMGYSFESAVADIIDNSISAGAHEVVIRFPIDPVNCYIAICDDGAGMNREELIDAMKYGSEMKREGRTQDDLGRFGLGLKSASLSQCRKLTVASKKDGVISAYTWDLDVILEQKDWYMVECSDEDIKSIKNINYLDDKKSGTIVIWENFDVIEKSSGNVYAELSKLSEVTANYLSLIFHRFLNKTGNEKLEIKINNYSLKGLDPFLENHKKTDPRRKIIIPVEDSDGVEQMVTVQPFVLPFQKDLSAEDKKLSGGVENYRSKQGFYVYRNERLIVWGKWFGRHREELTKYARVRVDIPNSLDDIWGIDIKKQNAKIPAVIKARLNKAVDEVMDIAVKKQTHRGIINNPDDTTDRIWNRIEERDQYSYQINRNSKVFELIKSKVDDEAWAYVEMVIDEIEKNLPYQQIYIDQSQGKIAEDTSAERLAEIKAKAETMLALAKSMGSQKSRQDIIESLFVSEPFCNYPDLKAVLLEE